MCSRQFYETAKSRDGKSEIQSHLFILVRDGHVIAASEIRTEALTEVSRLTTMRKQEKELCLDCVEGLWDLRGNR